MTWQFRFTGEQLARFIPTTGVDLVAFDAERGEGNELFLLEHFEDVVAAEDALENVVDTPCFLSFALPPPRARQMDLFTDPTSSEQRQHGSQSLSRLMGSKSD